MIGGACGSSPTNPSSTGSGGNSLSGTYAFPVQSAVVGTGGPAGDCGYAGLLPGGGYAAFQVILVDVNVSALCADASAEVSVAGKTFVVIQTKSASYSGGAHPDAGLAAVAPGTYPIIFEDVTDDDLCGAPSNSALVDVRNFKTDGEGAIPVASAVTGSVTYTMTASGHVTGNFSVQMAALLPSGQFDTTHVTPLSGSFDAAGCTGL